MVEGHLYVILANYNIEEFPQLVLLSFSAKIQGLFPRNPQICRICRHIQQLWSEIFLTGVIAWPPRSVKFSNKPSGGQIYANIASLLCLFGGTLNPLTNSPYLEHQPLTQFVQGGLKNCTFLMSRFQGNLPRYGAAFGGSIHRSYIEQNYVQFLIKSVGAYSGFGVIQIQT